MRLQARLRGEQHPHATRGEPAGRTAASRAGRQRLRDDSEADGPWAWGAARGHPAGCRPRGDSVPRPRRPQAHREPSLSFRPQASPQPVGRRRPAKPRRPSSPAKTRTLGTPVAASSKAGAEKQLMGTKAQQAAVAKGEGPVFMARLPFREETGLGQKGPKGAKEFPGSAQMNARGPWRPEHLLQALDPPVALRLAVLGDL